MTSTPRLTATSGLGQCDLWDGLRAPTRGYPIARPVLPRIIRSTADLRHDIEAGLRAGALHRVGRGLVARGSTAEDPELEGIAAMAHRLSGPFVVSHRSAARLLGLWLPPWDGYLHVTRSIRADHRACLDHRLVRHSGRVPPEDIRISGDLLVTSIERTVVDCARSMPVWASLPLVDSALLLGARRILLDAALARAAGARGVRRARTMIAAGTGRIGSPYESRVRGAVLAAGMPPPQTLIEVSTAHGDFEIDLGWERIRLGIEAHGRGKYGNGADPVAEAIRREALFAHGWAIIDVRTGRPVEDYLPRIAGELRRRGL
ncbi:hypothetical protein [Serinibacter salmoneus]|uniref:Transcriptional regulator, AbiEi antitoxin, Type IV TA system n=1 Tax=Serinibacter salmoneus TaxID=556530 RepID=A0A2A9CWI9_9MICO|nr:hypothetical protein [Serinibacter salmoneus]PFG18501.1 Transcriptional regulator, AbiEi antitoxin, Type IV TA system [Serinibacter salmoneus]